MPDTRTRILDLAEAAIRSRGYHAVSFRDLADELGIKSASIHYHFRHKEDMGLAVVDRYAERIGAQVGPAGALAWPDAVARFCEVYRDALITNKLQCLCGMLAAESLGLPEKVSNRVARFFKDNIAWLEASMPADMPDKTQTATSIQCEIQGAMTISVSLQDTGILDGVAKDLSRRAAGTA